MRLFVCLLVSLNHVGILMLFCCKLSAASASLAVKEFYKSVNVRQKYRQTHCVQFIGLHFRNIRSRSCFETLAENSCPLTSDAVTRRPTLQATAVVNLLLLPA